MEPNMQHLPEFPPLPDCFSHLVIADGEPRSLCSLFTMSESTTPSFSVFSGRPNRTAKIDSFDEIDHYIMNGKRNIISRIGISEHSDYDSSSSAKISAPQSVQAHEISNVTDQRNPFLKLQTSLLKLQREMKDLRYLDISLFCQLLSLHEAVQEFKMTVADRYSETGSEYSLGSASYMGSMSSLNDDSDWGEDGTLLISSQEHQECSELVENTDENTQSASSLLKQITELVLRADNDF